MKYEMYKTLCDFFSDEMKGTNSKVESAHSDGIWALSCCNYERYSAINANGKSLIYFGENCWVEKSKTLNT